MRILIDIGHPAHVHKFVHLIKELDKKGSNIIVTTKNVNAIIALLEGYNINYVKIGEKYDSLLGKFYKQIIYAVKLLRIIKKYNVTLLIGGITCAHVSKLCNAKSIIFDDDDDEVQPLFVKYAHPYCDTLLSPESLKGKRKKKGTIFYSGFHELAYLHPNRFKPDASILDEVGLKQGEPFFIMRFNVFKAHHDIGVHGLSLKQKLTLINFLEPYGKIFITTEREIEPELKRYQVRISPEKIHHLMSFATMFLGDSQTMTSEAAVLGIPAIRSNSFVGRISYLEEEEHRYKLTYGFKPNDFENMLAKIDELLKMTNLKEKWQKRREQMLSDKIDVTAFMVWFVEHYPESIEIMAKNPDYQLKFK